MIVGLANPGSRYSDTRHNAGAWLVTALTRSVIMPVVLKSERKLKAELGRIDLGEQVLHIAIPTVYMNESGEAVRKLLKFYNLSSQELLIIHDDIDLIPGQVKLKLGGGHGGHNGLRSIIAAIGSKQFYRLRIGVGHPGDASKVVGYVLHRPSHADKQAIEHVIQEAVIAMPKIVKGDVEIAMNYLHTLHNP
ncbi:MAG: aminoacyl-tRNA hydrolase [Gammaproteobacteria bacterium]|nr:aminoacyl-tRNA hydrolase [Gammaproteobacteria bacterium]